MSIKKITVAALWILLLTGCGAQENTSVSPSATTSPNVKPIVSENSPTVAVPMAPVSSTWSGADTANAGSGPKVAPNPEEHPKFEELKKKQTLLSDKMGGLKNPEYLQLNKDLFEIYEGKEIWPAELKKIDAEFIDVITQKGKAQTGSTVDFQTAFTKRNDAVKAFQASQAYRDYMVSNKEKLDLLADKQAKFMTPEIIKLKEEIDTLGKEVYATTPQ